MKYVACGLFLLMLVPLAPPASASEIEELATDPERDTAGCTIPCVVADPRLDLVMLTADQDKTWLTIALATRTDPTGVVTATSEDIASVVEFFVAGHHLQLRATTDERQDKFSFIEVMAANGRAGGPEGFMYDDLGTFLKVPADAEPWSYSVQISKLAFADWMNGNVLFLDRVSASILTIAYSPRSDRMPDVGYALASYQIEMDGAAATKGDLYWNIVEADDFTTATSLIGSSDGALHLAYIVDDDSRDTPVGLYSGRVAAGVLVKEKVAAIQMPPKPAQQTSGTIQFTSTAIAVGDDGLPRILAYPAPHQGGGLRLWSRQGDQWTSENPAAGPVADGYRDIPAIVAGHGRVIVAYQTSGDALVIREKQSGGWTTLHSFDAARYARLALDATGMLHVAYFVPEDDEGPNRALYGSLHHAVETSWSSTRVADDIEDRTLFWKTAETDGSFAFALSPSGVPSFVYETDRGNRLFAQLVGREIQTEPSPLEPTHGNIQNRMRMVFDADGRAHIVSGYGDADLYAIRYPDGSWVKADANRYGMFQVAVLPDGRAAIAGTQPDGGRTMAIAVQTTQPEGIRAAAKESDGGADISNGGGGDGQASQAARARDDGGAPQTEFVPAMPRTSPGAGIGLVILLLGAVLLRRS